MIEGDGRWLDQIDWDRAAVDARCDHDVPPLSDTSLHLVKHFDAFKDVKAGIGDRAGLEVGQVVRRDHFVSGEEIFVLAVLRSVQSDENGALLIALSESVLAPLADPGPGFGIVPAAALSPADLVSVAVNSNPISGTAELVPELAGFAPFSVIRFTPAAPIPVTPSGVLGWWPADANVLDVIAGNNGVLRGADVLKAVFHAMRSRRWFYKAPTLLELEALAAAGFAHEVPDLVKHAVGIIEHERKRMTTASDALQEK